MKKISLLTAFLLATSVFAGVAVKESQFSGKKSIVLSNEFVQLTFVPETGGRCLSCKDLTTGREYIGKNKWGLFGDHWASFVWPSGLMHLPYSIKMEQAGDSASVTLSVTVPAKGGGVGSPDSKRSKMIPTSKELVGLVVSKTITLTSGSPLIHVCQVLANPTKVSKSGTLGFQQHFSPGTSNSWIWNIPAPEGLIGPAKSKDIGRITGKNWCKEPVGAWNCGYDPVDKTGMVFAFDYNMTDKIYSSGGTAEWFLESVTLAPGKKMETDYYVRIIKGEEQIVYAGKDLYAGVKFTEKNGKNTAFFSFTAMGAPVNVDLKCMAVSGKTGAVLLKKSFRNISLTLKPQTVPVEFSVKEPSIVNNTVFYWDVQKSSGKNDVFEYNYIGNANEFRRRYEYGQIGAGAAALAGGGLSNAYQANRPRKIQKREVVNLAEIRGKVGKPDSVLVLFGLYTNYLRIHESLNGRFGDKIHWANALPDGIQGFPGTREELFKNKLVVMSNVNFKALRDSRLYMLDDFIREGGTLLICGGFYTYGHGEYKDSVFEAFCPFEGMKPFELVKGRFHLKKTSASDVLASKIKIDGNDEVIYLHALKPKGEAKVLVTAGQYPGIAVMKYGKGRVIGCAMTVMGESGQAWYDGQWWKNFLREIAK